MLDQLTPFLEFVEAYWPYAAGAAFVIVPLVLLLTPIGGPKLRRSFVTAVRNLWLHKLRSFLSVLGIIIGTAAVIALMAFGEGSMQDALDEIMKQGATNIIVTSIKPPDDATSTRRSFVARYGLTHLDYDRFRSTIPNLVTAPLPMRTFAAEVRPITESRQLIARIVATTPHYYITYGLDDKIEAGRFIVPTDEEPMPRNVCVLGATAARELFPAADAIGETVRFAGKNAAFSVIGVLKSRSPSTSGADIEDFDRDIYIPLAASRALLGETVMFRSTGSRGAEQVQLSQIVLTVEKMEQVRPTAEMVISQLEMFHRSARDWAVKMPLDKLEQAERTRDRYRMQMFGIAGISLLVGGIGIMNIMLATVTERTREIGIRRALGAKRGDVTFQFLVEAVVQTTIGGLIGVGIGITLSYVTPIVASQWFSVHWPAKLHLPSVFIAFFFAVIVGIAFGWYPSRRAARLDPIEALRHE
jgi:putative ABC transport system permease protein